MSGTSAQQFGRRSRGAVAAAVALGLVVLLAVGFLGARRAQRQAVEQTAVMPTRYWVVGPFGPDLRRSYEPETDPHPQRTYRLPTGEEARWHAVPLIRGANCLDFRAVFTADDAVGYALTYVHSPEDHAGELRLGSDDTIAVWVNGEKVHESLALRPGSPDQDRAPVRWKRGWNTLLIKVGNGSGDHLFFATLVGAPGLRASLTTDEP